jgi:hypothetical protein
MYRVNRFLIDLDNGGLSGFLYNVRPAQAAGWSELHPTADAVAEVGDAHSAHALREVAALLEALPFPGSSGWGEYLVPIRKELGELESTLTQSSEALWAMLEAFVERTHGEEPSP